MEINTENKMENFVKKIDETSTELLTDNQGYVMFVYNEVGENKSQENTFSFKGKLSNVAECIYSCMKNNAMLANVIIAAGNAYAHHQVMEANMQAEPIQEKKTKRTSKKSK
jgi:uncharacterized protein (UPF0128 family)